MRGIPRLLSKPDQQHKRNQFDKRRAGQQGDAEEGELIPILRLENVATNDTPNLPDRQPAPDQAG